jgi:tetratricopeptide (TPR) repeat protein
VADVHAPSEAARAARDRGLAHFDAGRFEEALSEFEGATDIDLNFAEAYGWASAALVKLGRLEEAMRAVDHAIWLDQFYAWGWNRKGVVFNAMGDFAGAATCFRKALEADPELKAARENLRRVEPLIGVNAAIVNFGAEKQEPYRVEAKGAPKKGRKAR